MSQGLLGSFAEKLLRTSPVPVWTIRRPGDFPPARILVPYDFSSNAAVVLPAVTLLARQYDAEFSFVHVIEPRALLPDPVTGEWSDPSSAEFGADAAKARELFDALRAEHLPGVRAEFETRRGHPCAEIVRSAEEHGADTILLATHGRAGIEHFLLGSVTEKVARHAAHSVLVLRPDSVRSESSSPRTRAAESV